MSPVEGVSNVTVVAPDVVLPAERAKTATIYWIDAQFGLPTPAITPAGAKQTLTTTVWRQSNNCPRAGWIVRYEVVCGPQAVFGPAGSPTIEARPMRPDRPVWRSSRRIRRPVRTRCGCKSFARPIHAASG